MMDDTHGSAWQLCSTVLKEHPLNLRLIRRGSERLTVKMMFLAVHSKDTRVARRVKTWLLSCEVLLYLLK